MSVAEKRALLRRWWRRGAGRALIGKRAQRSQRLDRAHARRGQLGCAGVLMLRPSTTRACRTKPVPQISPRSSSASADERLQLYLYHIPPVSQVPISLALIEIACQISGIVAGVKDSWASGQHQAMLETSRRRLHVFAGSEVFLARQHARGGKGCITPPATSTGRSTSSTATGARRSRSHAGRDHRDAQDRAEAAMIPALKAIVAHYGNDPQWRPAARRWSN